MLARVTHWVDTRCGLPSHFEDLISQGRGRPFEIEHIWANHYEEFATHFKHPSDFEEARNRLGGLLLLQRGLNQSLGDATYEAKRDAYLGHSQNLLARSLHPQAYQNNPAFKKLIADTGLGFHEFGAFGPEEQAERQELYLRLAEWVWNPSRLDLDGEKPPVPDPIGIIDPDGEDDEPPAGNGTGGPPRGAIRKKFFTHLLDHAAEVTDLHAKISPGPAGWVGTRRHGQWWNYAVTQEATRAELYIDSGNFNDNKPLFDHLFSHREEIEAAFGGALYWQRLDNKRASRVSFTVPGGWTTESTWPTAIEQAVDAMKRLYEATGARVEQFVESN